MAATIADITSSYIRETSFTVSSEITSNGGLEITEKGFCYATTENPTVESTKKAVEGDDFEMTIDELAPETTYYVRAYAVNSFGTGYSEQIVVTTPPATGAIIGAVFSVGYNKKVLFSQGNLQYQASTSTWRFAGHQYDIIGSDNSNISSSYSGWIDLFGWGTSGYNGKNPYMTSTDYSDYGDGNNDIAGTNYDWGVYNAISNGGNQAGQWRTLTKDEWEFLINTRTDASSKKGFATVNDVTGLILLPNNWTLPNGLTFISGDGNFAQNTYSTADWAKMEAHGAVFLPAAGHREGTDVVSVGSYGLYWSSTACSYLTFKSKVGTSSYNRYMGRSVRLVKNAN